MKTLLEAGLYVSKGPHYRLIPLKFRRSKMKGTVHDWLVARICQVGVRSVQRSRRCRANEGIAMAARRRGRKRKSEEVMDRGTQLLYPATTREPPRCDAGTTAVSLQESGKSILHGVEGRFLLASESNAQAHATALVLGRLYLLTVERLVSERTLPYLLRLLQQSGVPVGQVCHNPTQVRAFLNVCAAMRSKWTRQDFWTPPRNLSHPSAWRLVFDGFTLRSGATVIVVLVVYTNSKGEIATEFLGCTPPSDDSTGPACATKIVELLEDRLGVQSSEVACTNTRGLPVHIVFRRQGLPTIVVVDRQGDLFIYLGRLAATQAISELLELRVPLLRKMHATHVETPLSKDDTKLVMKQLFAKWSSSTDSKKWVDEAWRCSD